MKDFIISNYPTPIYLSQLKSMIIKKNESDKDILIQIIEHRLKDRYMKVLNNANDIDLSSFLILAISCLLIETLQCFYEGRNDTNKKGEGQKIFKNFFKRESLLFPGLEDISDVFYKNIRCGILHQAETKEGWRLNKNGPLLDKEKRIINGLLFYKSLKEAIDNYLNELRVKKINETNWVNAYQKLDFICKNCNKPD